MKKTPLKRSSGIKKVSERQKDRLERYYAIRKEYLNVFRTCQICCSRPSTDVHHRKYRFGDLLFDTRWFMPLCRPCHRMVHQNIKWAKVNGYILSPYSGA